MNRSLVRFFCFFILFLAFCATNSMAAPQEDLLVQNLKSENWPLVEDSFYKLNLLLEKKYGVLGGEETRFADTVFVPKKTTRLAILELIKRIEKEYSKDVVIDFLFKDEGSSDLLSSAIQLAVTFPDQEALSALVLPNTIGFAQLAAAGLIKFQDRAVDPLKNAYLDTKRPENAKQDVCSSCYADVANRLLKCATFTHSESRKKLESIIHQQSYTADGRDTCYAPSIEKYNNSLQVSSPAANR